MLVEIWLSFCFFFSSSRRHTRCLSDWSSDVCSSDLGAGGISVINSSPTIRGNVIRDCSGDAGGILLSNSDGLVEGNTVDHNQGSGVAIGAGDRKSVV